MKYLILYIACLTLGSVGAWFVVRWGSGFGLLDRANERVLIKALFQKAVELEFWRLLFRVHFY